MPQTKHEFFKNGFVNQKTPDLVINLKRADKKQLQKWTTEQKEHLKGFLQASKASFEAYIKEITDCTSL